MSTKVNVNMNDFSDSELDGTLSPAQRFKKTTETQKGPPTATNVKSAAKTSASTSSLNNKTPVTLADISTSAIEIASHIVRIAQRLDNFVKVKGNNREQINKLVASDTAKLLALAANVKRLSVNKAPRVVPSASQSTSTSDLPTTSEPTSTVPDAILQQLAAQMVLLENLSSDVLELKARQAESPPVFATSYANVTSKNGNNVKQSQRRVAAQTSKFSCVYKAKDAALPHSDVQTLFRKKVDLRPLHAGISKSINLSNKTIRLEFDTLKERDDVMQAINQTDVLTSEVSKKKNPLVIFKGVSSDVDEADLLQTIVDQNPNVNVALKDKPVTEAMKIRFQPRNRKENLRSYVVEVTPDVRTSLLDLGRVNVGQLKVHVEDRSSFLQCYKCFGFGHTTKHCKSDHDVCGHCSEHHKVSECTVKSETSTLKCINCKKSNVRDNVDNPTSHGATSKLCPHVKKMCKRASEMTDYGA